ncbi:hypothetical protein ALQ36_101619 [Pseudomonas syringae pv. primulae]|uniref:Uncharacterized protein n=1 Tax=Pseudomonas syringae pv. primulae TaxID=251707 RepID=A0A3M3YKK2_9PSED|nr:hypothetical protein ALQ36_101619 [Pseudomonas syringae pv. primulae]
MSTKPRILSLPAKMPIAIHGRLTLNDRCLIAREMENT